MEVSTVLGTRHKSVRVSETSRTLSLLVGHCESVPYVAITPLARLMFTVTLSSQPSIAKHSRAYSALLVCAALSSRSKSLCSHLARSIMDEDLKCRTALDRLSPQAGSLALRMCAIHHRWEAWLCACTSYIAGGKLSIRRAYTAAVELWPKTTTNAL